MMSLHEHNIMEFLTFTTLSFNSLEFGVNVHLGVHILEESSPQRVFRRVIEVVRHPNYNDYTLNNDVNLLRLSFPVTFTDYIRPVCLAASNSSIHNGTDAWLTGWGTIGFGGEWRDLRIFQE